jgi:bifunctional UDP-N-acetylglucosamine pyrophosphorylase / glucosamine-1-phosphate N-acetyltransferase
MSRLAAIILAAGKGTRMKSSSDRPKVLYEIAGRPMVHYPLEIARRLKCDPIVMVVGQGGEEVRNRFSGTPRVRFARQRQQLGSAHAVLAAESLLKGFQGEALILSGDVPLIREETVQELLRFHRSSPRALTLASFKTKTPAGYGRVIRDGQGRVFKIVEETDLTEEERKVEEVNGGLYVARLPVLFKALKRIRKNPVKKEFYFTDLPPVLNEMKEEVGGRLLEDPAELMGVNNRWELAAAERLMQERIQKEWMLSGVSLLTPHRTVIQTEVKIGPDTVLHPDVALLGKTRVGKGCVLEQGVILQDAILGDHVIIRAYSHVEKSAVDSGAAIGPFARIRPDSKIGKDSRVGNFVELKKTSLGEGSKANHLSYLGDARIGRDVNIGAGTITCNYDGVKKYPTKIEDGVFIGSDTQLVAPVKVGKKAYIGAGTTVTKDVPPQALALSRVEQKNIPGYMKRKKKM